MTSARGLTRVTYSPKVFIPLTTLCRDRCGYCTFAQSPAHVAPYLTLDQVVEIAQAGAEVGCHEALFTLGEAPEDRYPVARAWLDEHGYLVAARYSEQRKPLLRRLTRAASCSRFRPLQGDPRQGAEKPLGRRTAG